MHIMKFFKWKTAMDIEDLGIKYLTTWDSIQYSNDGKTMVASGFSP